MSRVALAVAFVCALAAPGAAQAPKSIDPGMSETKVVERLGAPDASRSAGDFKYLFYHNSCIKECGMDDVVILQRDSVVDAMFRSAERAYSGKSSSPRSIPAEVAARTRPGARDVPSGEVVQAGSPRPNPTAKHETASDSSVKSTSDSSTKAMPRAKQPKKTSASKARSANDSTHHDSVTGTLRIPVKPPILSARAADSARAEAAKRPPRED
jgi:hypothetical protein